MRKAKAGNAGINVKRLMAKNKKGGKIQIEVTDGGSLKDLGKKR